MEKKLEEDRESLEFCKYILIGNSHESPNGQTDDKTMNGEDYAHKISDGNVD